MKITMVIYFVIVVIFFTGWVKNVIKLSDCDFQEPYKAEVIHTIGLIPPVGAITGWLDLGQ